MNRLMLLLFAGSLFAAAAGAQSVPVYDDLLRSGFEDYSFGGQAGDINFASTAQVHSGAKSISFIGRNYSAVSFAHATQDFSTAQYPVIHFWIHGGAAGGQQIQIFLQLNGTAVANAPLDSYIAGGSIAANAWREVTVNIASAPLSYAGNFDRIDLQIQDAGVAPVLYFDDVELQTGSAPAANLLQIEHEVSVASMNSDRFTWHDSADKLRVASLAYNDRPQGPTVGYPNHGGALREYQYKMPDNSTRVAGVTNYGNGGYGGFGYVVSHRGDGSSGGIGDDSPLGYGFGGTWLRVFEGRHHAIFRFTQLYPRYSSTTANPPNTRYDVPVTIEWVFSTGHDNPLWSVTWDLSAVPMNALNDDSRAPYGELNIDGNGAADIEGVAWGDRYKFTTTTSPVTLNSSWSWNVANTVPWVKEWIASTNATMGTVQTQTLAQQDAGAGRNQFYHDCTPYWNTTSAQGNAGGANRMPWQDAWPYQSISFNLGAASANNNARHTWGTEYGFLGQQSYVTRNGLVATGSGWPKKSYSTWIVLGPHSTDPVGAQLTQVETMQNVTLTAATGTVVTDGPAGVNRADSVTYPLPGYNHIYGALALSAAGNQVDANIAVSSGTLRKPLIIISNYTAGYPTVKFKNVSLVADVDYFPSLRAAANELWITLNADVSGATNRLQITSLTAASSAQALSVDAAGNGVLEAGEDAVIAPSWKNETAASVALSGSLTSFSGPAGPTYSIVGAAADYGTVASGATAACGATCFVVSLANRPFGHLDATAREQVNDASSTQHNWTLHVGGSFADVPTSYIFYGFIERILHHGVTLGCSTANSYCPLDAVLRGQMAAFIGRALIGSDAAIPVSGVANAQPYNCINGGTSLFSDVAPDDAFCRHIHYIYSRRITGGRTATTFVPLDSTSRGEMAIFMARALVEPNGDAGVPPVYTDPGTGFSYDCTDGLDNHFPDVSDSAFECKHAHYLWARGIVNGFADGTYGSSQVVTRGAMAKFLANAFKLTLYKP